MAELAADEAAAAAWSAYLSEMAELAQWAAGDDEKLWGAELLQLDGWAPPGPKRHKGA